MTMLFSVLKLLLLVQAVRFFVFDYKLLKPIREKLKTVHPLLRQLLSCPFCQGFWTGMMVMTYFIGIFDALVWSFISAWLSVNWYNWVTPKLIKDFKNEQDMI